MKYEAPYVALNSLDQKRLNESIAMESDLWLLFQMVFLPFYLLDNLGGW